MWIRPFLIGLVLCAAAPAALASQGKQFGDYVVHYNAVLTSSIAPSVAHQYGITRSSRRGLLTVSVEKSGTSGRPQPVPADVQVRAANLARQLKDVDMHAVNEGHGVYYIGTFGVANRETIDFDISVDPKDSPRQLSFSYRKRFVGPEQPETRRRLKLE